MAAILDFLATKNTQSWIFEQQKTQT